MLNYLYNLFLKWFFPKQYKQLQSPNNNSIEYYKSKSKVLEELNISIKQYFNLCTSKYDFDYSGIARKNLTSLKYNVAYNKFLANNGYNVFKNETIKNHMRKYPTDDMGVICQWIDSILKEIYDNQIKDYNYNKDLEDKIKTYYK